MSERRATRRQLVRGAVAGTVGGAITAGAVSAITSAGEAWAASGASGPDADALTRALRIEQLLVIAYEKVLAGGALKPASVGVIRELYSHELEHTSTLTRALRALGATVPAPPADTAAAQRILTAGHVSRSLTQVHTQHDCLKLLIDVESVAEGAYFDAISALGDPAHMRTAIEIMGCEAQHWTILSGLLNRYNVIRSVPYPFVAGSK